ncbi:hypothetical protein DNTS_026777 [Danionella cerebrum]|uniref:Uncharacterized protein n=1 Tax=Danionella cerebrum TaxID=2873325 RepID=A0A553N5X8_9TELE|nr:hypothetical protein DNTS_026777 [Danionella translucida]
MLITLCYLFLWLRLQRFYSALIRDALKGRGGVTFSRETRLRGPERDSLLLRRGDRSCYLSQRQVCEDLSQWTPLCSPGSFSPYVQSVSFIIEASSRRIIQQSAKVVSWSEFCLPLAHRPGQPYRAIAQSSVEDFSRLAEAFLEDRLHLEQRLVPESIVSVSLRDSSLSELLEQQQLEASGSLSVSLQKPDCENLSRRSLLEQHTDRQNSENITPSLHQESRNHNCSHQQRRSLSELVEPSKCTHQGATAQSENLVSEHHHMDGHHLHLSSCQECLDLENSTILSVRFASLENIPDLPPDCTVVEEQKNTEVEDEEQMERKNSSGEQQKIDGAHSQNIEEIRHLKLKDVQGPKDMSSGNRKNKVEDVLRGGCCPKPPNVLVFTNGCEEQFNRVKALLGESLGSGRYTVYPLSVDGALDEPWTENTLLLVVAGDHPLPLKMEQRVLAYLGAGGRLLSLGSPLCPPGLVLCPRHLPGHPVCRLHFRVPGRPEIILPVQVCGHMYEEMGIGVGELQHWGVIHSLPLKTESESLNTESQEEDGASTESETAIVRLTYGDNGGVAVLSQSRDDRLRIEILKQILLSLGLVCELSPEPSHTPVYLLCTHPDQKQSFLHWLRSHSGQSGVSRTGSSVLKECLCVDGCTDGACSGKRVLHTGSISGSVRFDLQVYSSHLQTKCLGRTIRENPQWVSLQQRVIISSFGRILDSVVLPTLSA